MTTTAHLHTVVLHWNDLHEAAGQPNTIGGFGLGLRAYLARLDADAEQLEYEKHQAAHLRSLERDPIQLGDRPVPIRLHILDTMRTVHTDLLQCADAIAETVQRQPIRPPAPRRASYARTRAERVAWEDHARRVQAAQDDAADRRRWRWTGVRPDAPYTALWLLGRVQGAPLRRWSIPGDAVLGKGPDDRWVVEEVLEAVQFGVPVLVLKSAD